MTAIDKEQKIVTSAQTSEADVTASKKKRASSGKKRSPDELAASLSFEERGQRLGEIVDRLESGTLSLEESLSLYEEGIALVRASTRELDEAEQKVKILRRTAEGDIRPADFTDPEDDAE